jgi:hypothetical protein
LLQALEQFSMERDIIVGDTELSVLNACTLLLLAVSNPVFRAASVGLAISVEKDGNLRVVYARIGRCQGRPAWRGAQAAVARPYPAVTCHVG